MKYIPHRLTILSTLLIALTWCGLTYSGQVPHFFLPSPTKVAQAFLDMYTEGILFEYTWISTYRVGVGFLLAAAVAVPLGLLMGSSRGVQAFFGPTIEFTRYLPVVAMVPLLILYFGIGDLQKLSVIWIGTFFQLVLMVADVTAGIQK
ncbi:MAG TPA: ABC transporter permease, partial [Bacillota bacterium]|nr:ABC transporter permease [Bacillota bacterium]